MSDSDSDVKSQAERFRLDCHFHEFLSVTIRLPPWIILTEPCVRLQLTLDSDVKSQAEMFHLDHEFLL